MKLVLRIQFGHVAAAEAKMCVLGLKSAVCVCLWWVISDAAASLRCFTLLQQTYISPYTFPTKCDF